MRLRISSERSHSNPSRSARCRATVDLPLPESPQTTTIAGLRLAYVIERKGDVAARRRGGRIARGGRNRGVAAGQALDLGAHQCAMKLVERNQQRKIGVARCLAIRPHQLVREAASAEPVEIHREKPHVRSDVDVAQPLAELDAVDDRNRFAGK